MTVSQKRFLAVLGVVLCSLWVWFGGVYVADKWGPENVFLFIIANIVAIFAIIFVWMNID